MPMDMLQILLSLTAIFAAIAYPLFFLVRKVRSAANCVLFAALSAAAACELFDLLAIIHPDNMLFWKKLTLSAEGFLPGAWLLYSFTFARQNGIRSVSIPQRLCLALSALFIGATFCIPPESINYSPDFSQERILFLGNPGFIFYLALQVYLIAALLNLEITYANASRVVRLNIKYEILGAGALLAALIFYYSEVLLYRTINMNLLPIRSVALILAVILIAISRRRQIDGARIAISRNLVFKSVVLFAIGLYFIGLGLVGQGMKYFGESFQRSIVLAAAFAAGIGVLVILLSEQVKRKVEIMLIKNFYQDKYDYKTKWLQFTARLSSSRTGDELLTGILTCYCETFSMGGGALFLGGNDPDRFTRAAQFEMESIPADFSRHDPLLGFMQKSKWVVNVRESAPEPGLEHNYFSRIADAVLVIPLFFNGLMDGFILLGSPICANESYDFEDYDLMKAFASQTSSAILNLRLSGQLAEANEIEVLGKISTFVIHDLKNLVYTLSLIVDNAGNYITEPQFQQDMLESLGNTVTRMNTLIAKLKYLPEKRGLRKEPVDLLRLTEETATLITGADVQVGGSSVLAGVDGDEMQKVVLNLLLNAVEATDGNRPVKVLVGAAGQAFIRVTDEGCGIPEEYVRRHLFGLFKSTKKNGLGIGLYQCKHIVEAHEGNIEVISVVGKGTEFTVWLPICG
jgi:putative PEP-CTERM system histidine kinase